jgi:hypothetical protein
MARADAGREDQDASTHEVMLGQPVTKVSAQFPSQPDEVRL